MNTKSLSRAPIGIPARRRWAMFCRDILPIALFVAGTGVAALAWPQIARPPSFLAEVERVEAVLKPTQAGRLLAIEAQPFRAVKAGDVLARIAVAEPAVIEASLAKIRAEIDYLRASRVAELDGERARLQLDWLRERVSLTTLRMQLQEAESTFARLDALHGKKLVADDEHERARLKRETLRQQIVQQSQLVETFAPALDKATPATSHAADAALLAGLAVQEQTLRLTEAQLAEITLCAPIDGIVTVVYRTPGENVAAGEAVLTIAASSATHLVGFVRPPAIRATRAGMRVELRTRESPRSAFDAEIVHVGAVLEPIIPTLLSAFPANPRAIELGLRVQIAKPTGLSLRPGEQIEVLIRDES